MDENGGGGDASHRGIFIGRRIIKIGRMELSNHLRGYHIESWAHLWVSTGKQLVERQFSGGVIV